MQLTKLVLMWILLISFPLSVHSYEYPVFGSQQEECFAAAMIGMDSVINARLGVPAEHALDLTQITHRSIEPTEFGYDSNLLNVILNAYLWKETPHGYAVKVFFNCAQRLVHQQQVTID